MTDLETKLAEALRKVLKAVDNASGVKPDESRWAHLWHDPKLRAARDTLAAYDASRQSAPPAASSESGALDFPPLPKPCAHIGKFLDDEIAVFDGGQMRAFYAQGYAAALSTRDAASERAAPDAQAGTVEAVAATLSRAGHEQQEARELAAESVARMGAGTVEGLAEAAAYAHSVLRWIAAGYVHSPERIEHARLAYTRLGAALASREAQPAVTKGWAALTARTVDLHDKASMPWPDAARLALSEQGVTDEDIRELVGEAANSSILIDDDRHDFLRVALALGSNSIPHLFAAVPSPTAETGDSTRTHPGAEPQGEQHDL